MHLGALLELIFLQLAYDAGLHIPLLNCGDIAVGVESRTFDVTGLHKRIYTFKHALPPPWSPFFRISSSGNHVRLFSVYRKAQVVLV